MEIYQLRYFLAAARHLNLQKASKELRASAPSLSKAISSLEFELGDNLFERTGRRLSLTEKGKLFETRVQTILADLQDAALLVGSRSTELQISIAGEEIFLSQFAVPISERLRLWYPVVISRFVGVPGEEAINLVRQGYVDFALTTQSLPADFQSRQVGEFESLTCLSSKHPLYKTAKSGTKIPIEQILECDFAAPDSPLLGRVGGKGSMDGWRDDVFPRKIRFVTSSLSVLTDLVLAGKCLAYLPDFWAERNGMSPISIHGCNLRCRMNISLSCQRSSNGNLIWKNKLMKEL